MVKVSSDNYINVVGVTSNANNNYDIQVLRYNFEGQLQWSRTFDGADNLNDYPTGLALDQNGDIYISGSTESSGSGKDYVLIKIEHAQGNIEWVETFDRNGSTDFATGLVVDEANEYVYVTGRTEYNAGSYDFTTLKFDFNGSIADQVSETFGSVDKSLPVNIKLLSNGDVVVCGTSKLNSTKYSIRVICYDNTLTERWSSSYSSGFYDEPRDMAIGVDDDIYISGLTFNGANTSLVFLKYSSVNGYNTWQRTIEVLENYNSIPASIKLDSKDNLYFTGTTNYSDVSYIVAGRIDSTRQTNWFTFLPKAEVYNRSNDLILSKNYIYITCNQNIGDSSFYKSYQFEYIDIPQVPRVDNNGDSVWVSNQVVVYFQPDVLSSTLKNDPIKVFSNTNSFLDNSAKLEIENALGINLNESKTLKVIPWLTENDTVSYSRDSQLVEVPDFWNLMILTLPESYNESDAIDTLNKLDCIKYAFLNTYIVNDAVPNDQRYTNMTQTSSSGDGGQHSLRNSPDYFNTNTLHTNINVEPAWDITTGSNSIKVGVVEKTGIDYKHQDFHMIEDDQGYYSSKVRGYDYVANATPNLVSIKNEDITEFLGHATAVAGIIGAVRNSDDIPLNKTGIAGIAGGNASGNKNKFGVYLYQMRAATRTNTISAILEAAWNGDESNTASFYIKRSFGLHLLNFSMHHDVASTEREALIVLKAAYNFAYKNGVIMVAARGNDGGTGATYPATFENKDWIISVGASETDGLLKGDPDLPTTNSSDGTSASKFGLNMDLLAPGTQALIYTVKAGTGNGTKPFTQTSGACPHVTGVAALLLSYYNKGNGANINLAPEDVQAILQKTAFDIVDSDPNLNYPIGYDQKSGYGMVDAGNALNKVYIPNYKLEHYNTDQNTTWYSSQYSSSTFVDLKEKVVVNGTLIYPGKYELEIHKLLAEVNFSLPNGYTLLSAWPRGSASNLISHPDLTNYFFKIGFTYAEGNGVTSTGASFFGLYL